MQLRKITTNYISFWEDRRCNRTRHVFIIKKNLTSIIKNQKKLECTTVQAYRNHCSDNATAQ